MPRTKIRYDPIDVSVTYDKNQWDLFRSKRELVKKFSNPLNAAGIQFLVYGSVARGDVNPLSDIDIIILRRLSSFQIESILDHAKIQILGKEIVQATPGDAIKGHIYLPNETTLTFFLSDANEVSHQFYHFGGAITNDMLEKSIRTPGVTKRLTLIIPNEQGHKEINLVGNETYAQQLLGVHPKIIDVRKRVLMKRDKTGRTGVFLKESLSIEQNFEEVLKKIADTNPIVRRKILQ
ncbi:MAG: nucleotidyltransferase [Promethearchaeota archaeon]|nr:MAG: nucleotidyltransferase [Candidatus Lokiarchaeota archaeon]